MHMKNFLNFLLHFVAYTVYPKKYAHGFCFAVLCCGYTLTDFPISIRLTSLALWQSNYCPSASKATLMNMDKYFMWIHYERLRNHNKAKHNNTVCIFLGIYCKYPPGYLHWCNENYAIAGRARYSSPPGQNAHHFGRRHYQMHFLEWRLYNSDSNFNEIYSQESNWQ